MFKIIWWIIRLIPTIIRLEFYCLKYSSHHDKYPHLKVYRDYRKIGRAGFRIMHIDLHVEGTQNIPNIRSYILTPNHQSMFDIVPLVMSHSEYTSFVAKKELEKVPLAGNAIKSVGGLFLDRNNLKQEIRVMSKMSRSCRSENVKWCIFPEGTRSKNPDLSLNEFKSGAFKFPCRDKMTIVPVALYGTNRLLSKKTHLKRYPIYISYLTPITYDEYKDISTSELAEMVRNRIQNKINEITESEKYMQIK